MPLRAGAAGLRLGVILLAALLGGCRDMPISPPDDPSRSITPLPGATGETVTVTGVPAGALALGATVQLTATVRDAQGKPLAWTVKWRSADSTVARVSASGVVTAVAPGRVDVVAGTGKISGIATVNVVPAPATVTISSHFGAMYVGQTASFTATARDAWGYEISGLHMAWTSSNPLKATVDSAGKVTAVGDGPVTVTVSAGTTTASAAIAVAPRPLAEWSQAGPWTTFQGNARHTGYVVVTADPLLFRPLWEETVASSASLNPVTTGGGKVFVTTRAYFGGQMLSVLDVQTGGEVWTKEFGGIHGVHPPAYGDGRVYVTTSGHEDSFLWGFDASTGAQQVKSPYGNQWSRYLAPVVADGRVYMAGGTYGGMYAFRTSDGGQAWFANTNQYDEWTPAVDGGLVYAYTGGYSSSSLRVVSAATGAPSYEIPDPNGYSWGQVATALSATGKALTAQAGRLVSFDLAGRRIGWEVAGQFSGAVTVAGSVLYVVNNGRVEARRESNGSLLWSWSAPDGAVVTGTTIATRNLLFVSTYGTTYAIDLAARQHSWSYPAGGQLALSAEGVLLIARENGNLAAIALR